jgi:D-arabinose 1-dehydrogenase-like Zn-dependent alcohol dehydrogenase
LPSALARIPDALTAVEAAPLMCAGVTTFNALRHSGASPGDRVAVLGVGGLGHLGIQYSANMGFETIAIARGKEKEELSRKLGARYYIDNRAEDPAAQLRKLGGARVVLATATDSEAMMATLGGLSPGGRLMVIGVGGALQVPPDVIITRGLSVHGWYSGLSIDSQDTLAFSAAQGIRSMNETAPLAQVSEAYDRAMSGKARFRMVLTME